MDIVITKLSLWWRNEGGLETAEWVLVLGAVLIPISYFIMLIAQSIARFYEITSWVTTLPFP